MLSSFGVFSRAAVLGSFFIPFSGATQTLNSNHTLLDSSVNYAISVYAAAVGSNARLYTGSQYKEVEVHDYDAGHPFFYSNDWSTGSVFYDGQHYTRVDMLYDVTLDKVIIENPYSDAKIELIQDRVAGFSMAGHHFVHLAADTSSRSNLPSGFYDVLYNNGLKVFAKRSKEIVQKIDTGLEKKNFKEKNRYFIYKKGIYFPVKSKSSLLRVLGDRKTILKREIANHKIDFNQNRESAISQVARFYDESENRP